MYLWDTNMLRYFVDGHPTLQSHLRKVPWSEIAIPSVVMAEVLRGRCDYALKAPPSQAPLAHKLMFETLQFLQRFNIVLFDEASSTAMQDLMKTHKAHKRYADMMIAAIALAGRHIVVTCNQKDFMPLLPRPLLTNWID